MFNIPVAHAHCDIPCKIYDPMVAQVSALSVARLVDLILEQDAANRSLEAENQFVRLVAEKEAQAKIVKHEISVIWGDYFKQPQIEAFPDVHSLVHNIMLASSKCKQNVNRDDASNLVELVNQFTSIFWSTKNIQTRRVVAPYPPALAIVQPILSDA
ncbi:MAG TPA: superoxide dismutase, Ni [Gammaproteobacteria bacterium]|nr:superoxide dismutase, Ni [Gammaproteobacteria bacterium]